jgi:hypothetical protein
MRYSLMLLGVVLVTVSALAQQAAKFEVAIGAGTDIIYTSTLFKSDHNLSVSICYKPTDESGVALYVGQQVYSLDRLSSEHEVFLGGRTPQIKRTVSSLLVGYRGFIPSKSMVFSQYGTVALGFANSVSSAEGYYTTGVPSDTVFNRVPSGYFLLGFLSFGVQVRPISFIDLFAELQTSIPLNIDLSSGLLSYRVGVGVVF